MKTSAQPPLVMIGGGLNILAGGLNLLVGFFYILLCYGIVVLPVGLWQIAVGAIALTGKRVPSHLVAAICGAVGSLITFNFLGLVLSIVAAGLLGFEMTQVVEDD
jgi:hypothetical protein